MFNFFYLLIYVYLQWYFLLFLHFVKKIVVTFKKISFGIKLEELTNLNSNNLVITKGAKHVKAFITSISIDQCTFACFN